MRLASVTEVRADPNARFWELPERECESATGNGIGTQNRDHIAFAPSQCALWLQKSIMVSVVWASEVSDAVGFASADDDNFLPPGLPPAHTYQRFHHYQEYASKGIRLSITDSAEYPFLPLTQA